MGMELPAELRWALGLVGMEWPEFDEELGRLAGQAWTDAMIGIRAIGDAGNISAEMLNYSVQSVSLQAFNDHWGKWTGPNSYLDEMYQQARQTAALALEASNQAEFAKWSVIIELTLLAIQLTIDIALAVVTGGESMAEGALAVFLAREGIGAILRRLFFAVALAALPDAITQTIQLVNGHNDGKGFNGQRVLNEAGSGFAFGLFAEGVGWGAGKALGQWAPAVAESLRNPANKAGRTAYGTANGIVSGTAFNALQYGFNAVHDPSANQGKSLGDVMWEGVKGGLVFGLGMGLITEALPGGHQPEAAPAGAGTDTPSGGPADVAAGPVSVLPVAEAAGPGTPQPEARPQPEPDATTTPGQAENSVGPVNVAITRENAKNPLVPDTVLQGTLEDGVLHQVNPDGTRGDAYLLKSDGTAVPVRDGSTQPEQTLPQHAQGPAEPAAQSTTGGGWTEGPSVSEPTHTGETGLVPQGAGRGPLPPGTIDLSGTTMTVESSTPNFPNIVERYAVQAAGPGVEGQPASSAFQRISATFTTPDGQQIHFGGNGQASLIVADTQKPTLIPVDRTSLASPGTAHGLLGTFRSLDGPVADALLPEGSRLYSVPDYGNQEAQFDARGIRVDAPVDQQVIAAVVPSSPTLTTYYQREEAGGPLRFWGTKESVDGTTIYRDRFGNVSMRVEADGTVFRPDGWNVVESGWIGLVGEGAEPGPVLTLPDGTQTPLALAGGTNEQSAAGLEAENVSSAPVEAPPSEPAGAPTTTPGAVTTIPQNNDVPHEPSAADLFRAALNGETAGRPVSELVGAEASAAMAPPETPHAPQALQPSSGGGGHVRIDPQWKGYVPDIRNEGTPPSFHGGGDQNRGGLGHDSFFDDPLSLHRSLRSNPANKWAGGNRPDEPTAKTPPDTTLAEGNDRSSEDGAAGPVSGDTSGSEPTPVQPSGPEGPDSVPEAGSRPPGPPEEVTGAQQSAPEPVLEPAPVQQSPVEAVPVEAAASATQAPPEPTAPEHQAAPAAQTAPEQPAAVQVPSEPAAPELTAPEPVAPSEHAASAAHAAPEPTASAPTAAEPTAPAPDARFTVSRIKKALAFAKSLDNYQEQRLETLAEALEKVRTAKNPSEKENAAYIARQAQEELDAMAQVVAQVRTSEESPFTQRVRELLDQMGTDPRDIEAMATAITLEEHMKTVQDVSRESYLIKLQVQAQEDLANHRKNLALQGMANDQIREGNPAGNRLVDQLGSAARDLQDKLTGTGAVPDEVDQRVAAQKKNVVQNLAQTIGEALGITDRETGQLTARIRALEQMRGEHREQQKQQEARIGQDPETPLAAAEQALQDQSGRVFPKSGAGQGLSADEFEQHLASAAPEAWQQGTGVPAKASGPASLKSQVEQFVDKAEAAGHSVTRSPKLFDLSLSVPDLRPKSVEHLLSVLAGVSNTQFERSLDSYTVRHAEDGRVVKAEVLTVTVSDAVKSDPADSLVNFDGPVLTPGNGNHTILEGLFPNGRGSYSVTVRFDEGQKISAPNLGGPADVREKLTWTVRDRDGNLLHKQVLTQRSAQEPSAGTLLSDAHVYTAQLAGFVTIPLGGFFDGKIKFFADAKHSSEYGLPADFSSITSFEHLMSTVLPKNTETASGMFKLQVAVAGSNVGPAVSFTIKGDLPAIRKQIRGIQDYFKQVTGGGQRSVSPEKVVEGFATYVADNLPPEPTAADPVSPVPLPDDPATAAPAEPPHNHGAATSAPSAPTAPDGPGNTAANEGGSADNPAAPPVGKEPESTSPTPPLGNDGSEPQAAGFSAAPATPHGPDTAASEHAETAEPAQQPTTGPDVPSAVQPSAPTNDLAEHFTAPGVAPEKIGPTDSANSAVIPQQPDDQAGSAGDVNAEPQQATVSGAAESTDPPQVEPSAAAVDPQVEHFTKALRPQSMTRPPDIVFQGETPPEHRGSEEAPGGLDRSMFDRIMGTHGNLAAGKAGGPAPEAVPVSPPPPVASPTGLTAEAGAKWTNNFAKAVNDLNQGKGIFSLQNDSVKSWLAHHRGKEGEFQTLAQGLIDTLASPKFSADDAYEKLQRMKEAFPPDAPLSEEARGRPESSLPTTILTEVLEPINAKRLHELGYSTLRAGDKSAGGAQPDYEFTDSGDVGDHVRVTSGKTLSEFQNKLAKSIKDKVGTYRTAKGQVHVVADAMNVPVLKQGMQQGTITDADIQNVVQNAVNQMPEQAKAKLGNVFVVAPSGKVIVTEHGPKRP